MSLLLTLLAVCGIVLLVGLLGLLFVVVPFVLTVDRAEQRGFATFRWGLLSLVCSAGMLADCYLLMKQQQSALWQLAPLALTWVGPMAVTAVVAERRALVGLPGLHEP